MAGTALITGASNGGAQQSAGNDGSILCVSHNSPKPTFRYTAVDITPVATATDVLVLKGSATKTIRVTRAGILGTATAASIYDLYLTKRTTANTGGTSTAPTPSQSDSSDAAATATLALYTANPSALGTGVTLEASKVYLPAGATPAGAATVREFFFGSRNDKAPVLRGTAESIAFNFAGQAVPAGASLYMVIEWTEDSI
jgi:hypothetical protein